MTLHSRLSQLFWFSALSIIISMGASAQNKISSNEMNYSLYAELLDHYVNSKGFVDYKGLKANKAKLEQAVNALNKVKESEYNSWNEPTKIAYWCNAYNICTLKAIVDHYPIKAGWISGLRFPKNSIRQISGVWDTLKWGAMGQKVTLSEIEHEILRVKFTEPRIHFAINCASVGCPPLRNEPFYEHKLEVQLVDQVNRFLANPQNYHIDQKDNRVFLSSILSWFGKDFEKTNATKGKFLHLGDTEHAVIDFISNYVSEEDFNYLKSQKYDISYTDYDWSLNEQS